MLKTLRVYLSALMEGDSEKMIKWINTRELVLFNSFYKPISKNQHEEWINNIQKRNDVYLFCIRLSGTDELIGTCQLHSINFIDRNAEVQIRIGEIQNQGQGFGTEALELLVQFAFNDLNLIKVYLYVIEDNKNAIRVYEKVGFFREGLLKKHCHIDGGYRNLLIMSILRNR